MASHTEILGDIKLPIGTYTVTEQGQQKTRRRHRQIGTLMEMTYDSGNTQMVAKLNLEVFSIEIQALLRANGILAAGDDAIMCNVYSNERRTTVGDKSPEAPKQPEYDGGPF